MTFSEFDTETSAPLVPHGLSQINGHAPVHESSAEELTDLRLKVKTLPIIEQSKGILMGYYGIPPDTAFSVLCRWSSHTNIKLRVVSALLVDAASHPDAAPDPRHAISAVIDRLNARTDARGRATTSSGEVN